MRDEATPLPLPRARSLSITASVTLSPMNTLPSSDSSAGAWREGGRQMDGRWAGRRAGGWVGASFAVRWLLCVVCEGLVVVLGLHGSGAPAGGPAPCATRTCHLPEHTLHLAFLQIHQQACAAAGGERQAQARTRVMTSCPLLCRRLPV